MNGRLTVNSSHLLNYSEYENYIGQNSALFQIRDELKNISKSMEEINRYLNNKKRF
jgi:hypothetical protein